jgi:predicted Zn-dependent peptidase
METFAAHLCLPGSFAYSLNYASIAFYFAKLVETVAAERWYMPTEHELSVAGLRAKLMELQQLNDAVTQAEIELTAARRKRNALFYKEEDSLFAIASATKQYVRGAFGFSSDQRVEVSRIRFTKPKS